MPILDTLKLARRLDGTLANSFAQMIEKHENFFKNVVIRSGRFGLTADVSASLVGPRAATLAGERRSNLLTKPHFATLQRQSPDVLSNSRVYPSDTNSLRSFFGKVPPRRNFRA
jgi:hypothetical protein